MRLSNRTRFITSVINGTLKVNNRKRAQVEADLDEQGYDRMANGRTKVCMCVCVWGGGR